MIFESSVPVLNVRVTGTDVPDIFAQTGHAVRISKLQSVFDDPDRRYGKGLDWTGYSVHDAANILLRYLKSLPESVVPYEFFDRFTEPIKLYQKSTDAGEHETDYHLAAVLHCQDCVKQLPPLNRQLLLYLLDILAVIASKADVNRMMAARLASVFNPGILSGPPAQMDEEKHLLALDTLVFLIENQDNFLIGYDSTS